jgi:hypothetical protein
VAPEVRHWAANALSDGRRRVGGMPSPYVNLDRQAHARRAVQGADGTAIRWRANHHVCDYVSY